MVGFALHCEEHSSPSRISNSSKMGFFYGASDSADIDAAQSALAACHGGYFLTKATYKRRSFLVSCGDESAGVFHEILYNILHLLIFLSTTYRWR